MSKQQDDVPVTLGDCAETLEILLNSKATDVKQRTGFVLITIRDGKDLDVATNLRPESAKNLVINTLEAMQKAEAEALMGFVPNDKSKPN